MKYKRQYQGSALMITLMVILILGILLGVLLSMKPESLTSQHLKKEALREKALANMEWAFYGLGLPAGASKVGLDQWYLDSLSTPAQIEMDTLFFWAKAISRMSQDKDSFAIQGICGGHFNKTLFAPGLSLGNPRGFADQGNVDGSVTTGDFLKNIYSKLNTILTTKAQTLTFLRDSILSHGSDSKGNLWSDVDLDANELNNKRSLPYPIIIHGNLHLFAKDPQTPQTTKQSFYVDGNLEVEGPVDLSQLTLLVKGKAHLSDTAMGIGLRLYASQITLEECQGVGEFLADSLIQNLHGTKIRAPSIQAVVNPDTSGGIRLSENALVGGFLLLGGDKGLLQIGANAEADAWGISSAKSRIDGLWKGSLCTNQIYCRDKDSTSCMGSGHLVRRDIPSPPVQPYALQLGETWEPQIISTMDLTR